MNTLQKHVNPFDLVFVIGSIGSGKTVLMSKITGFEKYDDVMSLTSLNCSTKTECNILVEIAQFRHTGKKFLIAVSGEISERFRLDNDMGLDIAYIFTSMNERLFWSYRDKIGGDRSSILLYMKLKWDRCVRNKQVTRPYLFVHKDGFDYGRYRK